ncbi:MAG TPA: hypothetical protein VH373_20030 [Jatrophihabitantaceae bacterium]
MPVIGSSRALLANFVTNATYHGKRLGSARPIVRDRGGQSVWISRTARGHELIDLLT